MKYKTHMVLWAESGEGFSTVCGITDECSEKFFDEAVLVAFGNKDETTCKRCLKRFSEMLTKRDIEVTGFRHCMEAIDNQ